MVSNKRKRRVFLCVCNLLFFGIFFIGLSYFDLVIFLRESNLFKYKFIRYYLIGVVKRFEKLEFR